MLPISVPIDYLDRGQADHMLELHVRVNGTYWLSVRGPRSGLVVPFAEYILSRGWLFDALTADKVFSALMVRLGVDIKKYRAARYYYSGSVA